MTASVLVDTNVLVYAYDRSEPEKQKRAVDLLDSLVSDALGTISTQVLVEFVSAVTRKIPSPLSAEEAYSQVEEMLRIWPVLGLTGPLVLEAVRGVRDHGFSIWDAQIWATARLNGINVVLSEDFNSGSVIEGVEFVNPFLPGFDAAELPGSR